MNVSISDFVKNENLTSFDRYRCGQLYYRVLSLRTNRLYEFPVPIEDLQQATINNCERALTLMRYIRKAISENTLTLIVDPAEKADSLEALGEEIEKYPIVPTP